MPCAMRTKLQFALKYSTIFHQRHIYQIDGKTIHDNPFGSLSTRIHSYSVSLVKLGIDLKLICFCCRPFGSPTRLALVRHHFQFEYICVNKGPNIKKQQMLRRLYDLYSAIREPIDMSFIFSNEMVFVFAIGLGRRKHSLINY